MDFKEILKMASESTREDGTYDDTWFWESMKALGVKDFNEEYKKLQDSGQLDNIDTSDMKIERVDATIDLTNKTAVVEDRKDLNKEDCTFDLFNSFDGDLGKWALNLTKHLSYLSK